MPELSLPNEVAKLFSAHMDRENNLLFAALIATVINFISIVFNLYIQIQLKNKDKDVNKAKMREEKRIIVYENVFDRMNSMSLFTQGDEQTVLVQLISEMDSYINSKRIYVLDRDFALLQRFNDYFRTLLTNPKAKDFSKEKNLIEEFVTNFND